MRYTLPAWDAEANAIACRDFQPYFPPGAMKSDRIERHVGSRTGGDSWRTTTSISSLPRTGEIMTNRITLSVALFALISICIPLASRGIAADKHARLIGLYDVTIHFHDPAVDWMQISDAFVKQFLVDADTNVCIQPNYLPARMMGNTQQQTPAGPEGTAGDDYVAFGDLYKDPDGYRMEAYLVRGKDRLVVLKRVQPTFTDPKDAPAQAKMAALELRFAGSGTRTLADLILDFEKKQRDEYPHDHAIAPELKVQLADSERYPLKLKTTETARNHVHADGLRWRGGQGRAGSGGNGQRVRRLPPPSRWTEMAGGSSPTPLRRKTLRA